jgi:crossover junction endodeoxyribonuclease RuvC
MTIIAIDPGYGRCGVALLTGTGTTPKLLFSTCIETDVVDDFSKRMYTIGSEIKTLIERYTPKEMVIERLFFSNNQKTALRVAEVRGMLIFLAEELQLSLFEYDPLIIKIAVTGYGRSSKKDIISMLPRLISIEKKIRHDDEYDAIAIGITHLAHQKR